MAAEGGDTSATEVPRANGQRPDEQRPNEQHPDEREQVKDRLRRIEGQVRGIHRMVDEGRQCVDIITQILAARTALDRVAEEVITSHAEECLATMDSSDARSVISQAVRLLSRVQS